MEALAMGITGWSRSGRDGGGGGGCLCDLRGVTEAPVFGQRSDGAERLTAALAADLQPAVGVHALMPTQVRKLRVCLSIFVSS